MDPLQAALRPIARLLNRNIREITPALELCSELAGTVVAVRVRDTALAACFVIANDSIDLVTETDEEADVIIDGSLITLARMAGQSGEQAIRDGSLDLSGDARLAQKFQRLLSLAKPDLEEELSGVIGDAAAHRLGTIARGVGRWAEPATATMGANIREYLPSRYELERFNKELGELRDDVDRAEARLSRLLGDR